VLTTFVLRVGTIDGADTRKHCSVSPNPKWGHHASFVVSAVRSAPGLKPVASTSCARHLEGSCKLLEDPESGVTFLKFRWRLPDKRDLHAMLHGKTS
jgi:hypothetical protein